MRIGIDARFLTHPQRGGFKTYTTQLVAALAEVDQENEYVLYVTGKGGDQDATYNFPANFRMRVLNEYLGPLGMPLREQALLPIAAANDRLDLFHSLALTAPLAIPCPLVVTVHDMFWRNPDATPSRQEGIKRRAMQRYYAWITDWAVRKAAAIITVSNAARNDILAQLQLPPENVRVIHEAADPSWSPVTDRVEQQRVRARYGLPERYVLALASADPRKNVAGLLALYSRLPEDMRATHKLVLVWAHHSLTDAATEKARQLGVAQDLVHLHALPRHDLAALYCMASVFVFPSLAEGFGLPMLEAMRCGAPVLAAHNSSLPEVGGEAARYFDTHDLDAGAHTLAALLADDDEAKRLRDLGFRRAEHFSWQRCAQETISVYRDVMQRSRSTETSSEQLVR